jgi:anti-anti-sigma regulatory factor
MHSSGGAGYCRCQRLLWRRRKSVVVLLHDDVEPYPSDDAVVLTVTEMLTRRSARRVSDRVRLLPQPRPPVVLDLTAIPGFDTDGLTELLELRDAAGADRVLIVGLREAVARLVGAFDLAVEPTAADAGANRLRRMPGVTMVTVDPQTSSGELRLTLDSAVAEDAAIVIVDLAELSTLSADVIDAIAYASSQVAMAGQEMVLLNVSEPASAELRRAALAATTYIADGM